MCAMPSAVGNEELRVAVLQLNSGEDVEANLRSVEQLAERAAGEGAALVMLPENFAFLGPQARKLLLAEPLLGAAGAASERPLQLRMAALARRIGCYLLLGGFAERSEDPSRPYNTSLLVNPEGEPCAHYRKLHLFDIDLPDGTALRESHATSAGDRVVVTQVGPVKLGLSVCYDLRFPELYRQQVELGAQLLSVPSAFTLQTGPAHWHVLLRARAIENQCWVAAPAQWGRHPEGRASFGHALVVDPWGDVVAQCSDGVGYALADVKLPLLRGVRERLPCLAHRKL